MPSKLGGELSHRPPAPAAAPVRRPPRATRGSPRPGSTRCRCDRRPVAAGRCRRRGPPRKRAVDSAQPLRGVAAPRAPRALAHPRQGAAQRQPADRGDARRQAADQRGRLRLGIATTPAGRRSQSQPASTSTTASNDVVGHRGVGRRSSSARRRLPQPTSESRPSARPVSARLAGRSCRSAVPRALPCRWATFVAASISTPGRPRRACAARERLAGTSRRTQRARCSGRSGRTAPPRGRRAGGAGTPCGKPSVAT